MAVIYKITNLVNGKIYIGETTRTLAIRWKQHLSRVKENRTEHLYLAMKKYGVDKFTVEEIETCDDDCRFERETFYINKYNSLEPNGYNYLLYQSGRDNIWLNDIVFQKWKEGKIIRIISEELHLSQKTVRGILLNIGVDEQDIAQRKSDYIKKISSKEVIQYSLQGELINRWKSASEAGRILSLNHASISRCCKGNLLTYKDYIWQYAEDDNIEDIISEISKHKKTGANKKKILQFSLSGDFIQEFESTSAAGRSLNKAHSGIGYAARTGGIAYGFYWKYCKKEE